MNNEAQPNTLTPAQTERLAVLQEQLGTAQQAIGTIQRWGFARVDPALGHGTQLTNRKRLETALGGVICVTGLMTKNSDLVKGEIETATKNKTEEIPPSLIHQDETVYATG
jgi:hypothetical protein